MIDHFQNPCAHQHSRAFVGAIFLIDEAKLLGVVKGVNDRLHADRRAPRKLAAARRFAMQMCVAQR